MRRPQRYLASASFGVYVDDDGDETASASESVGVCVGSKETASASVHIGVDVTASVSAMKLAVFSADDGIFDCA